MAEARPHPAQGRGLNPNPIVDTAALAAHLGCSPSYVRLLVHAHVIAPMGRWSRRPLGRPTMWFSLDAVDAAIERAQIAGSVSLADGIKLVRK